MFYGSWWLLLGIVVAFYSWTEAQYCKELQMVQKTRPVVKTRRPSGLFQGFRTERFYTTEPYYVHEYRRVCCKGYERDSRYNCVPVCSKTCPANSNCVAPDRCVCRTGYQLNIGDGTCLPFCPGGCSKNSECTAPRVCTCLDGHRLVWDGNKNVCEPVCEKQVCPSESYCAAPEHCECNDGYNMTTSVNGSVCEPVCSPPCGVGSFCSQPDLCICENGYEHINDYESDQVKCQPICAGGCGVHKKCIAPNICACEKGYASGDDDQHNVCVPICQPSCTEHSHCESPNNCVCDVGYSNRSTIDSLAQCQPHCSNGCPAFSVCVAPDTCVCLKGYTKHQSVVDGTESCVPVCENGCPNGHCHEPNWCVCNEGYLMGPNKVCEPVCTLGCLNGRCIAPEKCSCNVGYHFKEDSLYKCEPTCTEPCVNGDCVAPDTCICWQDHEPHEAQPYTASSNNVCKPTCLPKCLNATCTSPHSCTCLPDYEPVSALNTTACKPKCSGCTFGDCIAPNNCQCWSGFMHNGVQCTLITTTTTQLSTFTEEESSSTVTNTPTTQLATHYEEEYTSTVTMKTTSTYPFWSGTNCSTLCDCWQKSHDLHLNEEFDVTKCERICVDAHDMPCLDLNYCRCDPKSHELVCDDGEKTEDGEDIGVVYYKCRVKRLQTTTESTQASEERMQGVRNDSDDNHEWRVLACAGIGVGLIAAACVFVSSRYVKRRNYIVNRMEPEYQNEAYEEDI